MKILLYRCGNERSSSQYPLGLGYLKSNCVNANISIVHSSKELNDCDLIGLSADASGTKEAIDILNSTDISVIIGGQVTLWEGIKKYPFKHIIYGDGEISLQKIIDGKVERLLYNRVDNVDSLIFPERGECGKTVPIITSRGCCWKCNFCSSNAFWGKVRYHSSEYFISEVLDILKKYPHIRELYILDDLFIGNKKRFQEIYEKWMSLGLNKKMHLRSFVRSNILTLEIARQMKTMGFKRIRFGAESGSDKILKVLNKCATVADHQKAIEIANKASLPISASFMHGLPEETPEDLQMTKDFIQKNKGKLTVEGFYKFQPFPGTKFYNGENPITKNMRVR